MLPNPITIVMRFKTQQANSISTPISLIKEKLCQLFSINFKINSASKTKTILKMKKLLLITLSVLGLFSCTAKWEYKIVSVKGAEQGLTGKFQSNKFDVSDTALNLFGKDGWEMVGVFEKTETVHPNFGNEQYVNGIEPNVRTAEIDFVFKRKK
jgi:hypothetical protein